MVAGVYEVCEQVGVKGYFGRVTVNADPQSQGNGFRVEFDKDCDERWQSGARFGIEYVLEHIPKWTIFPNGLRILVSSIEGHEVDTTNSVIAFVTVNALLEALQDKVLLEKMPRLDVAEGVIEFPM